VSKEDLKKKEAQSLPRLQLQTRNAFHGPWAAPGHLLIPRFSNDVPAVFISTAFFIRNISKGNITPYIS